MNYQTLTCEIHQDVATVTLNRPEVHNAFNEVLIQELTSCFTTLGADPAVAVIVLTGQGASFCAGADLTWMKRMVHYSKKENRDDSKLLLQMYETIASCPKPVIGRIHGHAFGGGIGLLAVCDITVGVPEMKCAFSEIKLGIIPAVISTFVAPRLRPADMRRLFITGERFDAAMAQKLGLLDLVVPAESLDATVQACVDQVRSSGPTAIKEVKQLIKKYFELDRRHYQEFTVEKIAELRVSPEGQEGITAFLEKRKPNWKRS
ncbi:MAG: enoyl-CoA hydratase/isomerase family protein [Candidatus Thermoplasmatota archaeon]|nr:enoyl-CoA hydratase/isomerase family protein [Candidatus Thermoplasmatota archaeon]